MVNLLGRYSVGIEALYAGFKKSKNYTNKEYYSANDINPFSSFLIEKYSMNENYKYKEGSRRLSLFIFASLSF